MLVLILHYLHYSDTSEIKSSMIYSQENYISNQKGFIKKYPLVPEIIASKCLKA